MMPCRSLCVITHGIHHQIRLMRKLNIASQNVKPCWQSLQYCALSNSLKESPLQYLSVGSDRKLGYRHTPSTAKSKRVSKIAILFLPGWMGTMDGLKARALEELSQEMGWEFARFDYEGLGESPGELDDMVLTDWKNNALRMLDEILQPDARVILVGSSMGGWLSMHLARLRRDRIVGIVAIAPALDFLVSYVKTLDDDVQRRIDAGESVPSGLQSGQYNQKLSKRLIDDTRAHHLLDLPSLDVRCPVRILHGMRDETVPWTHSLKLINHVESEDVELLLRKAGDHRLSTKEDISLLKTIVSALVKKVDESTSNLL